MKTSLIPAARLEEAFRPVLSEGRDILYVTISSGISGTVASGLQAAQSLQEEFPDRQVRVLDSLGAGFGRGPVLGRAADCPEGRDEPGGDLRRLGARPEQPV